MIFDMVEDVVGAGAASTGKAVLELQRGNLEPALVLSLEALLVAGSAYLFGHGFSRSLNLGGTLERPLLQALRGRYGRSRAGKGGAFRTADKYGFRGPTVTHRFERLLRPGSSGFFYPGEP